MFFDGKTRLSLACLLQNITFGIIETESETKTENSKR